MYKPKYVCLHFSNHNRVFIRPFVLYSTFYQLAIARWQKGVEMERFNIDNVLEWRDECFELVDMKHTHADRIRKMSDEELAEFLDIVGEDGISSQYADVPCDCCCEKTECSKCWKDWLQSEAE